jgi:hypothetical protein
VENSGEGHLQQVVRGANMAGVMLPLRVPFPALAALALFPGIRLCPQPAAEVPLKLNSPWLKSGAKRL